ncbi:MAG: efflux RND transporter permease subunit, partial [Planctomycetota bacterium]
MKLIDLSVERPVTVWVGVFLIALFGVVALLNLPVQMRPTVDKPEIRVETQFQGAAPPEVEQQVTNKLEEQLASVEDMKRMSSVSREGQSEISLEFEWGIDKNIAQLNVQKRLNRVEDLPDDAKEPVLRAVSSDEEQPIMWIFARHKEDTPPLDPFQTYRFIDENLKKRFERVGGVGDVWLFGGPEREIRVILDYERMSAFDISVAQVRTVIRRENLNVRGGPLERGKRRETARTVGQFRTPEEMADVIVAYRSGRPIRIRDFARVEDSFKEQIAAVRQQGKRTVVLAIIRRTGTNTLKVVEAVENLIATVNEQVLANANFELEVVYKDSTYIYESIRNVLTNLAIGGVLAVAVLLVFLRSVRSTIIIALSIPVSLIATFIFIKALGRTVNIVSLAGLGFAIGMVVDNAIVVLENTFRHMEEGEDRMTAARSATEEVWGAVLSSTLTTMAVFLPIVFLEVEAGQLFKDIAIAVACAVGMSMLVALTLVPMLCSRWLYVARRSEGGARATWRRVVGWLTFAWAGRLIYGGFEKAAGWILRSALLKVAVALAILVPCIFVFWQLTPDLDYLPTGNRNFIFGLVFNPPGSNIDYVVARSKDIERVVRRFPETERYFTVSLVGFRDNSFMGVQAKEEYRDQMDAFRDKLAGALFTSVPGLRFPPGIVLFKMPVFQEAMGGKSVEVNLTGDDFGELAAYSDEIVGRLQPIPGQEPLIEGVELVYSSLDVGNPERRVVPDRERSADLGFNVADIADIIQTLVGGSIVDTYKEGGDEYD